MQIFVPIARDNAGGTANGYQLMNHSHAEKGLKRNKNVTLILSKTPH